MDVLYLIMYLVAALCFLAATLVARGVEAGRSIGWNALVAFGLFSWVLVPLISHARSM